jgi:23S rRNA pseudouridine2605 synthase
VELVEGRNREIRRLLAELGHEVTRLTRISFGHVELGTLAPGRWRRLDDAEISALERDAGIEARQRAPRGRDMTRPGLAGRSRVR